VAEKMMFSAERDEADAIKSGLQLALDAVDKAGADAVETTVIADLKIAHQKICLAITFLNSGESDLGAGVRPIDARAKRVPKLMAGAPEPYKRAGFGRKCRKLCE